MKLYVLSLALLAAGIALAPSAAADDGVCWHYHHSIEWTCGPMPQEWAEDPDACEPPLIANLGSWR